MSILLNELSPQGSSSSGEILQIYLQYILYICCGVRDSEEYIISSRYCGVRELGNVISSRYCGVRGLGNVNFSGIVST